MSDVNHFGAWVLDVVGDPTTVHINDGSIVLAVHEEGVVAMSELGVSGARELASVLERAAGTLEAGDA